MEALNEDFQAFRRRFPDKPINGSERRLDKESFNFPAILRVEHSTKKDEEENFVVFRPRDQRALLFFGEYLRPESNSEFFFVDFNGKPLKDVSRYLREAGNAVGINGLSTNLLRSLVETANSLPQEPAFNRVEEVSQYLGHCSDVRKLYYILPTDEQSVQAAARLLLVLQEEGEAEYADMEDVAFDPVIFLLLYRQVRARYGAYSVK